MGYGGLIMWTALVRELHQRAPDHKVALVRGPRWHQRLRGRRWSRFDWSPVYDNNPRMVRPDAIRRGDKVVYVDMDDARHLYWHSVDDRRIDLRTDGHAIEILCRVHGIQSPELRGELFLTEQELAVGAGLAAELGPFVAVEPHTKDEFTPNKRWPFERWQAVVDALAGQVPMVQVGAPGGAALAGVRDLTGRLSFRETCAVLAHSALFLGPEGGLMHAAAVLRRPAVIVFGGYISAALTGYAEHVNLLAETDCINCGLRTPCPRGLECLTGVTPEQVTMAVRRFI
jgi:ADP-heptose:LPS heptosyltransferase